MYISKGPIDYKSSLEHLIIGTTSTQTVNHLQVMVLNAKGVVCVVGTWKNIILDVINDFATMGQSSNLSLSHVFISFQRRLNN